MTWMVTENNKPARREALVVYELGHRTLAWQVLHNLRVDYLQDFPGYWQAAQEKRKELRA